MILNMKINKIHTQAWFYLDKRKQEFKFSETTMCKELCYGLCSLKAKTKIYVSWVNAQSRGKLIFITNAETHPIFFPVWVRTVVDCFNNTASAVRIDTRTQALEQFM